jgi:hypothetical protein
MANKTRKYLQQEYNRIKNLLKKVIRPQKKKLCLNWLFNHYAINDKEAPLFKFFIHLRVHKEKDCPFQGLS